ncbi:ornithine cyclodeaminase family protein [Clostridium fermenticellae]|uniref:Delta(1)-pyrroline-2-carboxylate reductase n=1 Tax=Clostridium fermenticellae TaxID=2068654 RepID=A0A386H643_9CLOT|nr:ornithine cyclodeaminase family protein [Clostridium fermenticellae]AYD40985.1 ornithine cyclodeaminase family protein [Clostridium fermenticellae]
MLILNKNDIKKVFNMKDAIDAAKEALLIFSRGKSVVPLRTNIDIPKYEGQSLFMPAYVEGLNSVGIKIVSVFPENAKKGIPSVPAKMILLDGKTGDVICIMDGTFLTQLRTGATSGAATDILANKDSRQGALFGTGGQAPSQLEAMLTVRNLDVVKVFATNREKTQGFVEKMNNELKRFSTKIIAAESADDAVKDADIITTATTSKNPVFNGKLIKKGAHINAVGSYTPVMQELDEYTIQNADKIYMDSKDAVLSESGDFIIPIEKGLIDDSRINGELGEVISKKIEGRTFGDEITLYKTVGIAVMDVVTAYKIYEKALETKTGTFIDL